MSRISERICDIVKLADSSKVTDKRRCRSELSDLYQNDDVVSEICQNTKEKVPGKANWLYLIDVAHKLVIDEAEKPSKETNAKNNDRKSFGSLVIDTIRRAIETSAAFLKSSYIVAMILQILDSKVYIHYQDIYLGILVKYVLPKSINHSTITADQWRDLLIACTKLYKKTHLESHIVLDALQMIVDYSFLHTNLLSHVKSLLLFLENIFEDVNKVNNEQLIESFYKLSSSVCRQIMTESRIALCKFSENISMDILPLNSSEEKYRLLLIFLQIHHPEGISKHDDGAYAFDWDKWQNLLCSMFQLIQENCKLDVQWHSFIQFASEVIKQIIANLANFTFSLNGSHSQPKRRRTMNRIESIVDLVMESSPEETWPLVKILTETLRKYPQCLRSQDLAPLLQRLTELAMSRDESIMNNLYNIAIVLMENEMSNGEEIQDAAIHWSKIWDMLLRSLGANQNEESGHLLIRCFIRYNRILNANALLRLYLTKAIRWSLYSVQTLRQLCERISLPVDASTSVLDPSPSMMTAPICDRTRLLEWLLNIPWQKLSTRLSIETVEDICTLSVNLVLSSRNRQNIQMEQKSSQSHEKAHLKTFVPHQDIFSTDLPQLCHAFLTFKVELSVSSKDEHVVRDSEVMLDTRSPVSCVQEVFNFLRKQMHDVIQEEGSNDEYKNTFEIYLLMKLAFVARLLSTLKLQGILATEDTASYCSLMEDVIKKQLKRSFEILTTKDWDKCKNKHVYMLSVIRALKMLYGAIYDMEIAKIIVSSFTVGMIKTLILLMNYDDNYIYYEDPNTYQGRHRRSYNTSLETSDPKSRPREGVIRLQIVETLSSICALHIDTDIDYISSVQGKIMSNLLKFVNEDFSYVDSRMSLIILELFVARNYVESQDEYAKDPLNCLMELCEKGCKDEELLRRLLHLLPYFFEYVIKHDDSPKKIIYALGQIHKRIYQRNYSVLVHTSYMKCACSFVRIDPDFSWSRFGDDDDVLTMLNSILNYIDDALFVLRSQAVRCLQELLSFRNIAYKWKERIFDKVEKTVFKLLDETAQQSNSNSQNLMECQLQDERETRTVTALIALASVACASGVLQGRTLCAILRLITEKEVNVQIVQKVLLAAAKYTSTYVSLIEDNLNYLLTSWIEDMHCPLQSFPWMLVECKTIKEFFRKNINYVVPVLLRTSDIDEAISFCENHAGVAFKQIFEDVFPSCFVWLISRAIVADNDSIEIMQKIRNNTDEFSDVCNFDQLFRSRLHDVLIQLIRRLHDENDFDRVLSISSASFPAVDPPHFSRAVLDLCFDYLEIKFLNTRTLIKQSATLQKTLLQLVSAIHLSRSREDKLKRLHQYVYFCSRLTHDLASPIFNDMAAFLIRDVCYSLLHLTRNDDDETLIAACCKFLNLFLRQALPARATEVRDILRFVVANLIGLAQSKTHSVSEIAASLLEFLVVEQTDVLREAIAKLGSFPNHEIFRNAREAHNAVRSRNGSVLCLEDELERFLDAMSEENAECTLEDLTNFTQQLSTRKSELRELHRKLERPYPEDSAGILHRLIFKLIKLTESPNPRVSIEATKCLGELGPMDSTVALRPAGSLVQKEDFPIEALTYRSVVMLTSFLVENSVELRKVSADALYAVLSTSDGRKIVEKYSEHLSNVLECAPLKIEYIRPFIRSCNIKQTTFYVDAARFRIVMNPENVLWTVQNNENYAEWIIKVTCSVAECFADSYLENFLSVCRLSVEFCELILPRIVYLVIHSDDSFINAMCDCMNQFFRQHFAINEAETTASPMSRGGDSCDQKIVRRMLDVVNHIRVQLPDGVILRLDYVYLARAAHKCSAYYTCLLFTQLACGLISRDYPDFSNDPRIDYIYEQQPEVGRMLQNIMLDTYLNISDPDAKSGAGSSHVLDHDSRVQYYARINRWGEVMLAQDIELSNHSPLANARIEMANALYHSGLHFLQWQLLGDSLDEKFSYECAWRLGKWNLSVNDTTVANYNDFQSQQLRLESLENAFNVHHYHALKCFHDNDRQGIIRAIECGRMSVIHKLRMISPESSKTVNQKLSQLRLLREIEQLSWAADLPEERYLEILRRWNEHEISLVGQFDHVEPILWQRIIMFRIRESLRLDTNVQEAFFATCLDLAKVAEGQGNFSVATRALRTLQLHQDLPMNLNNQVLYQDSLLAWMNGNQVIARCQLRNLIEKKNPEPSLKAKALRVYGDWMAETKSENPQAIIQKYYLVSIEISEAIDEKTPDVIRNLLDTQVALARFADAQYQQISAFMTSPTYETLKEYACSNTDKVDHAQMMRDQNFKKAVIIDQKQSTNDAAELRNIEQEKFNYLAQALKYYLKTLCSSEEHNLLIFRLVALWLDNNDEVNEELDELLNKLDIVPSYKFVPLVPQLAAHISNDFRQQRSFFARIFRILERCALEHPYHTLPVVLALKNLHSDDEYESGPSTVGKREERRVLGAKKLLSRLTNSSVQTIIHEMENLSRALLSFAYWQPKGKCQSNKRYSISRDQPILKIKNLNNVLLPTVSLPVRPSHNYNNVVGINSYQDSCEFVGGVTAPKKIICIGTDGVLRRQLVKGKDDLRQDAVMQQVFTVMNTLLRTCKETQRRNLRIRTYKVVPLTQRSGVLEWCDNTVPIAATLVGNSNEPGLHRKYYPRDLTAEVARNKLRNVQQKSNEVKLKVFLECCKYMKPAFHHFFEEKYRSPETWVERTLTYTRSVATTSIAGYILGLGDRHLSNILIDERTAEVVHIDFGVAFEQGKVLPLPETIPFRLTRDIEVAMGVSGIEGTMRRSCEVTMTMLRDQKQIIITLLQVLLYDPLFTWAITPEKAYKMQSDVVRRSLENSGRARVETNTIANRALLRIEQKLQGIEDGLVSSVSGQVERLLREARDPANLCQIYCGWQPYL